MGGVQLVQQAKKQRPQARCEAMAGEEERTGENSRATERWVPQNLMAI